MEPSPNARTVQSYEEIAVAYAEETSGGGAFTEPLTRLAEAVPAGHVLDVGSGPGWDADELEEAGLTVRRTDVTQAFIDLQRARGKDVDRLDVIDDDLGGPYDAVVALRVLQHIEPKDLSTVLSKVAGALRPGGRFLVSTPRFAGTGWEVGDSGRTYYRAPRTEDEFIEALHASGLAPEWAEHSPEDDGWLVVMAQTAAERWL
ncbi:class I SAM-dependent methyltransferase [Aeromicrobium wangtongii]|uniref:Class I SAM-dependent methyltransferase n=1 Tax=Aeromicrobium wangtongii TaxID=2969247 RepID=A0ABY5MET2_9ACTN|nr:class I SAM-dependent methyltransferase [Aeromicrobium wangtongii]MCD9197769.1 class I SAM-dependent methyltransferase [Aeromicrobium wangtongii]UUP15252.1 class I SAM-dependent methyltransferase [Aeromicrobium wangtongii]